MSRHRSRRAFSHVEVLVGLALLTGPMLVGAGLILSGAREMDGDRFRDRAHHVLGEILVLLRGETLERVEQLAAQESLSAGDLGVPEWMKRDLERCRIRLEMDTDHAGVEGLVRLTLVVERQDGRQVRGHCLLRPGGRPEAAP